MARRRLVRLCCLSLLQALLVFGYSGPADAAVTKHEIWDIDQALGVGGGGVGGSGGSGALSSLSGLRPGVPIRVALISSGVDTSAFPSALSSKITTLGYSGDPVGYGTYAASVLFQLMGTDYVSSYITSLGSYPGASLNPETMRLNLEWVINHASDLDVVLFAFPPGDFLDPITAAMDSEAWEYVLEAIADAPLAGASGQVLGAALSYQEQSKSFYNDSWLSQFKAMTSAWTAAIDHIDTIESLGLPMVVPAGDHGPNPQTVLGLANLPEVLTVGGYNPSGFVSTSSASGPSMTFG